MLATGWLLVIECETCGDIVPLPTLYATAGQATDAMDRMPPLGDLNVRVMSTAEAIREGIRESEEELELA